MKKTTEVTCHNCEKTFLKYVSEIKRSDRLGRKHYCSRKCVGHKNYKHLGSNPKGIVPPNLKCDNRKDEFSPFRYHLRNAKMHSAQRLSLSAKECTITLQDLKSQWEKQNGKCPYTGWDLDLLPNSKHRLTKKFLKASLDRIISSRGYTPDNIQFVCYMANTAKNVFSCEELFDFCKAAVAYQSVKS